MPVKANQKHLLEDCKNLQQSGLSKHKYSTTEKSHGRLEVRKGFAYTMNVECLDLRWESSNIQSFIAINRDRTILKNGQHSNETAYFVTNLKLTQATGQEIFTAGRKH